MGFHQNQQLRDGSTAPNCWLWAVEMIHATDLRPLTGRCRAGTTINSLGHEVNSVVRRWLVLVTFGSPWHRSNYPMSDVVVVVVVDVVHWVISYWWDWHDLKRLISTPSSRWLPVIGVSHGRSTQVRVRTTDGPPAHLQSYRHLGGHGTETAARWMTRWLRTQNRRETEDIWSRLEYPEH